MSNRIQELEGQVAELILAVEARDTFIAVAGHELRNPMTPVLGQLELLIGAIQKGRGSPEELERRILRIQKSVRHYVKRATMLLDVSRLTSGKLRLEPEAFDLAHALREIVDDFSETARRLSVPLSLSVPNSLPVTLDRLAIEQILDNLLSNAFKYGMRSPIQVTAHRDGESVNIEVRDGGPGIHIAHRERVFGRFERAVGTGERRSGFGVGLWVVGQLVAAMGGTVAIGDASGGGATFRLVLPLHPERK